MPAPRQVFAVALNYRKHADEGKVNLKETDFLVFTKFPSCIVGPNVPVHLPSQYVDWEVELTAVIGREAFQVKEDEAWSYVAGLMIGQDLSEREVQLSGAKPQFSLGKSYPGFGPTGPYLVTPDEFADPDNLRITCRNGTEVLQDSRTSEMIYSVSGIISRISQICPLLSGDLVFTGTPEGVGPHRRPRRYLTPERVLISRIEGIGEMTTRFYA